MNGRIGFLDCYKTVEDDFIPKQYGLKQDHMVKAIKALDIICEGDPMSMKEAFDILDVAKSILLDNKMVGQSPSV